MTAADTAKQNQIYKDHFRAVMPSLSCVEQTKYIREPDAGYMVVWLFPVTVTTKATNFNQQINNIIPTFRFNQTNLHTTITVYQSQPQVSFKPDEDILQTLADICDNLDSALLHAVQIDFKEWLFQEGAVIAAGQCNKAFWQIGAEFQAAGVRQGHNWRMPWGAHMTVARFLNSSDKTKDLWTLANQTPAIGLCQPVGILVGHFRCGPSALHFTPFSIRKIRD